MATSESTCIVILFQFSGLVYHCFKKIHVGYISLAIFSCFNKIPDFSSRLPCKHMHFVSSHISQCVLHKVTFTLNPPFPPIYSSLPNLPKLKS